MISTCRCSQQYEQGQTDLLTVVARMDAGERRGRKDGLYKARGERMCDCCNMVEEGGGRNMVLISKERRGSGAKEVNIKKYTDLVRQTHTHTHTHENIFSIFFF